MVSFDGGSASKVDDVTALPSRHKMADMLLWQRYDNNKMVAMRYYGNVFYIFNSTVIDWTLCVCIYISVVSYIIISFARHGLPPNTLPFFIHTFFRRVRFCCETKMWWLIYNYFRSYFVELTSIHAHTPILDYTLITNLMHWLLFIHKILFSSTCFEHQVLIFRT